MGNGHEANEAMSFDFAQDTPSSNLVPSGDSKSIGWSGIRESNPSLYLGKVVSYR